MVTTVVGPMEATTTVCRLQQALLCWNATQIKEVIPTTLGMQAHITVSVPVQECHESAPPGLWEELSVTTLTWRTACHSIILSLWDPNVQRFVPFPEWLWLERLLMPELHDLTKKAL